MKNNYYFCIFTAERSRMFVLSWYRCHVYLACRKKCTEQKLFYHIQTRWCSSHLKGQTVFRVNQSQSNCRHPPLDNYNIYECPIHRALFPFQSHSCFPSSSLRILFLIFSLSRVYFNEKHGTQSFRHLPV